MRLLPEKIVDKEKMGYKDIEESYKEITHYDIFQKISEYLSVDDYKDVKIDVSKDEGLVSLFVKKEKLLKFLKEAEKIKRQADYDKKFILLRERLGDDALKYLIGTPIDPDILVEFLPPREIIEKDFELYYKLFKLSCGYHYPEEGLLSIELAKQLALGKTLDEYPEKLEYHYYWYPKETKSVCEAPFTKQEFLDSIQKEKTKIK